MQRRELFAMAGVAAAGLAVRQAHAAAAGRDVIVSVFLRGAMDGLNVVVPFADPGYYALRPSIAIREPGGEGSALNLDGFFGLHPAAAALLPYYQSGQLAFVHAVGAPASDRSHFSSQALVERGVEDPGVYSGWLGRHLESSRGGGGFALRGVSISEALDASLVGSGDAAAIASSQAFALGSRFGLPWRASLGGLYAQESRLGLSGTGTLAVVEKVEAEKPFTLPPDNGAQYPQTQFGGLLREAAQYIKADIGVEVISVSKGGWDHHAAASTALPNALGELCATLQAFVTDLGSRMANVTLVTMSEFGRRAGENASGGTDHGRGGLMLALGGGVHGGRVYGSWPGLAAADLDEGDLAITTDYRAVLGELLARRAGNAALGSVFPGYGGGADLGIFAGR